MPLTSAQRTWLDATGEAAEDANHIFPTMAACEAALESAFGTSELARNDNNLFGCKQHTHPIYGTENLPTKEFLDGQWKMVEASWIKYPSVRDCFLDRMVTLVRLAPKYPHYAAALETSDAEDYVRQVSMTWSTDPRRADKVIAICNEYLGLS